MEYLNFCISDSKHSIIPITVDAIYEVFADRCYQISHLPIAKSFVFVSTLNGKGKLNLEKNCFYLQSGDAILFDADRAFSYQSLNESWNFWWFEFRILTSDLITMPTEKVLSLPLSPIHQYLCKEALNCLKLKDFNTASSLFTSLLCLLQKQNVETPDLRRGTELFQKADQYMRQHLNTATVESTADYLNVSEHTLLNVFQSLFGIRTIEYLQHLKTDLARHLLLTSETTIKEISDQLGYADQFTFSKSFRKRFGRSPTQYRIQAQKKTTANR